MGQAERRADHVASGAIPAISRDAFADRRELDEVDARVSDEKCRAGDRRSGDHAGQLQISRAVCAVRAVESDADPAAAGPQPARAGALACGDSGSSPSLTYSKGQIGARWLANDDNGDSLLFKVEIRGVNETVWKLLKDKLREHYFSWDSTAFPDGKYVLRITASDAPSNPPDQALTASLESDPFLIDNTPPEITGLTRAPSGNQIEMRFHAKDALSVIGKAEYSVNGGDWLMLDPVTRLTDSKEEDYRVLVDRARRNDHRGAGRPTSTTMKPSPRLW